MDVEEARVAGGTERLNAQAARFLTGRTNDVAERLFHGTLVSRARMKTSENEQLQAFSSGGNVVRRAALRKRNQGATARARRRNGDRAGLGCEGVRMAHARPQFSSPEIPIA